MMNAKQSILGTALVLSALALAANARAAYWTPFVSEENNGPPTACMLPIEAAMGFGCTGNHCDNVDLKCMTLPNGIWLDTGTDYWSAWFSEETNGIVGRFSIGWYPFDAQNFKVCEPTAGGGVLHGVRCSGSNCDNMSIECAVPKRPDGSVVTPHSCFWSPQFSEGQGTPDFQVLYGDDYFITGIQCFGSYCDSLSYYLCVVD